MNLTIAIVFVRGTATTRIESECLAECAVEGCDSGAAIDRSRRALEEAFTEIYMETEVEVLFPELGECENIVDRVES